MGHELTKKSNTLSHLTVENLNLMEELQDKEHILQTIQSNDHI